LRSAKRRLTTGLRREEVAELAGVGPTWYTWLEQARDIRPSELTLRAIARALQLTKVETRYLLRLGLQQGPVMRQSEVATPSLLAIVNGIGSPVLLLGQLWDLIACNAAADALFDLEYAPSRNLLQWFFTPQSRALHPNWDVLARQKVALFRAHTASMCGHAPLEALLSQLAQRCPEFRQLWAEQGVSDEMYSGHITFDHPFAGRLAFDFEFFCVLESPNLTMETYVCDGAETRARLDELMLQRGQHGPKHCVWSALARQRTAPAT
jgi:transcriptional regulator with XRE-family HTH domain